MNHYSTLSQELAIEEALVKGIRSVFRADSEMQNPSSDALRFVLGYAASCESVETCLLGNVTLMNN